MSRVHKIKSSFYLWLHIYPPEIRGDSVDCIVGVTGLLSTWSMRYYQSCKVCDKNYYFILQKQNAENWYL